MLEEKFAMQKVFISFHHANDQGYKDLLIGLNEQYGIFDDVSVDTHNIADDLPTQTIRQIIRDDYLRDSTVTIVLVGTETRRRKHVDWEIKSSMIDGSVNKNREFWLSIYHPQVRPHIMLLTTITVKR